MAFILLLSLWNMVHHRALCQVLSFLLYMDNWIIDTIILGNLQLYIQQVYLKELFDLKHKIMQ